MRPRRFLPACGTLVLIATCSPSIAQTPSHKEWTNAGGDPTNSQFSTLDQITPENVVQLEQAWIYHSGDASAEGRSQIQCNPIIINGVLYGTSPALKLLALNAATGEPQWTFDPFTWDGNFTPVGVNRGVVYWEGAEGEDARILFTAGYRLFAIDCATGKPVPDFGVNGYADLREGLGRDPETLDVISNTPGVIHQNHLILGSRVGEGPGPSAPGHIRAYDTRTGTIAWTFHTIPKPGEFGHDTWPADAWERVGGANAWSGMSVDHERGWVFIPTGSAAFDFWGGDRHGANLFGNCLLVLNATTGHRIWHYQIVHHDLWDRDLPAAPNLLRIKREGEWVDAVAQVTKSGHVFVFDRETGTPLFPIEERPVPASDLLNEAAWPTQPFPLAPPPFSRQTLTETDLNPDPEVFDDLAARLKTVRTGQPFIPPSETGSVVFPGFDGGAEWGGAAHDPNEGLLYINANEMPWILTMVRVDEDGQNQSEGETVFRRNCVACHGIDRQGSIERAVASLVGIETRMAREEAATILSNGKGLMPPFSFLSQPERDQLIEYLFTAEAPREDRASESVAEPQLVDKNRPPYTHTGYNRFIDKNGNPAVKPPWGTLNAIDLNEGIIRWQVPLGQIGPKRDGEAATGAENYGGPVVTAGGVIFIAASKDEKFRAFDKLTGKLLWETSLPAGGYATPSTYEIDGRQYVVIAAGGGKMGTKSGDAYVAFALPDSP